MGNSAVRLCEAQEDLAGMLRTLAQQVDSSKRDYSRVCAVYEHSSYCFGRGGSEEKATRSIEAIDQNKRAIDILAPLREQVQHLEAKMEDWQTLFPVRSVGGEVEDI